MPVLRHTRTALAVAVAGYVVSLLPGVRPAAGIPVFWDIGVYVLVALGAATVCGLRAARLRRDRLAWALISLGLTCYAAGTFCYYVVLEPLGILSYPSVADGLWLLLYPLVIVGVGLMVKTRVVGSAPSMWLDGLVSGLGLASLSAVMIFPRVTAGASGPFTAIATNFAYPLLDLALVVTIMGAMAALGAWRDGSWLLMAAGFLTFSAADSWYLTQVAADTYALGGPVDACYMGALVLVACSASVVPGHSTPGRPAAAAETRSFLVPGAFALLAVVVLALQATAGATSLGVVLAVGALTAAWVRTTLAVREVVQLSDSRRQSRTDALTGLPNRRAFYELLEAAETGPPERPGSDPAIVILVVLDRFKEINDAVGHQLGDQLLREVSRRFAAEVPAGGSIARLGGDEMALFVPGMCVEQACLLSQRLLDTLIAPVALQDMSLHLGASIGITAVAGGAGVSRVLARADLAMYRAKAAHTGWEVYDDERDGDAWDRLATVEALREALSRGDLRVELQPIVALSPHGTAGMEALVRWTHPTRGRIAPDTFLPLAERAGLMPAVTRAVIELALTEVEELRRQGWTIPLSVNLSASDLLDDNLVDHLAEALAQRNLPGSSIRIEITESLLVDTKGRSSGFLARIRALGIDLAVDDYGTGYSSLAYLHDLPVSYLKIDRSFTSRLLNDARTAVIVASTIQMAHGLDLRVVAEGVESSAELDWLTRHGCDLVQGYHTGRPMPSDRLHEWLAAHPPAATPSSAQPASSAQLLPPARSATTASAAPTR